MKSRNQYHVKVLSLREIHELPDAWTNAQFLELLKLLEYEDADTTPEEELKETAIMALTDLKAEEAAEVLLDMRLGEQLSRGQRQNLAQELKDDRIWEEYPKIAFHKALFNISCMLNWAFPRVFPTPDMVQIKLEVSTTHAGSASNLQQPTASFFARLLNDGMDEHNIILRLFEQNIVSNSFQEADHIIWKWEQSGFDPALKQNTFTLYTSWNWVDELKGVKSYDSIAFADGELV